MDSKNIDFHVEISSSTYPELYNMLSETPPRKRAELARRLLDKGRVHLGCEVHMAAGTHVSIGIPPPSTLQNKNKGGKVKLDKSLGQDLSDLFPD